nr:hypothetical protein [Tanacetum cinerariifolium]
MTTTTATTTTTTNLAVTTAAGTEVEQAKNFQNFGNGRDQKYRGQQSNRSANSGASGRVFAITEDHATKTS